MQYHSKILFFLTRFLQYGFTTPTLRASTTCGDEDTCGPPFGHLRPSVLCEHLRYSASTYGLWITIRRCPQGAESIAVEGRRCPQGAEHIAVEDRDGYTSPGIFFLEE